MSRLDASRWQRISAILDVLLELAPEARAERLAAECGDDAELRAEVEALLAADAAGGAADFLETPALQTGPELLQDTPVALHEGGDGDPMVGRSLGPYRVERRLGAGGMGVVYQGIDVRLDRRVALKLLPEAWSVDEAAKRRLIREARAASTLDHPNVCTLYDLGESDDGRLYLVLAYYEGETLDHLLAGGALACDTARDFAVQIARGLHHAHKKGVVHRDVKPANVMVVDGRDLKLLDFGVAHATHVTALSQDSVGTPAYMAPEQVRGEGVDRRADLWSLGVVLYEMLTGVRPFRGDGVHAVLHGILEGTPRPLEELRPEAPPDLVRVVRRALERDPQRRYGSAREMLDDLSPGVDTDPRDGAQPGAAPLRRRPWRGRTAAVLAASLLLVAVLLLLTAPRWWPAGGAGHAGPAAAVAAATPVEHYRLGRDLLRHGYRRGNAEQAAQHFRAALELDQAYAPAHAGLAEAFLWSFGIDRDRLWLDRAREQADLAVELDPQLAAARVARGTVLGAQRATEEAVAELRRAVDLDPLNADAHRELANVLFDDGRRDEARGELKRAGELAPDDWLIWERRGLFAYQEGDWETAITAWRRSVELAPDNAGGFKNLAGALIRAGRLEAAAAELQNALEVQPLAATYTNLGTLQFYLGRHEASYASFQRAIELGANEYLHWGNLGDACRWTGRGEEAAEAYRRAVQLVRRRLQSEPENATMRSRLALYLAKGGEPEAALSELEKLPSDTTSRSVAFRRLVVLEIAGRRDAALEALDTALEAGLPVDDLVRDPELSELRRDPRYHRRVAPYDVGSGPSPSSGG